MAREQREQDRKADAFLRIMTFTAGMDLWARWKIGALNGHRDTPEPQPPPPAEIMTTTALSNLYLSSAGERLLKDYFDARTNLSNAIGAWEKVVNPANVLAGLKALESLGEATQALREQLRAELEATRGGDT
ncbi:MAG TPA: hypothetical protein VN886_17930 [Acidimicrobiales bacterium]|nr:hypothetical protein [Acidimicrobiales bacterium]